MVVEVVPAESPAAIPGPLCPPRWAQAVRVLVEDVIARNMGMFAHFHEIDLEDIQSEAEIAGCKSWQKFDPRRAAPSRFIRRVSKCRLIDLYRQARLKHQRDRDYAPRQQTRLASNQLAFSRRLATYLRQQENRAAIEGDIFALLATWRLLSRYCCRLEAVPIWRKIPKRLRERINKLAYEKIVSRLREAVSEFCSDDISLISRSCMDHDTAAAHSSLYVSE